MADQDSTTSLKHCSQCQEEKPHTDFSRGHSRCKPCGAIAARQYRQNNPEKRRAIKRKWEQKNPEKKKAQSRRTYDRCKTRILNYWHTYYYQNHEKALLSAKKSRQKRQEERRIHNQNRHARKRQLPATFSVAEGAFCRAYFSYACAVCGREEGFQWTISLDHWIPLSSSACPGTVATNMIPLCHGLGGCNNSKKHYDPKQWLTARFGTRKAGLILKHITAYFEVVRARQYVA